MAVVVAVFAGRRVRTLIPQLLLEEICYTAFPDVKIDLAAVHEPVIQHAMKRNG